MNQFQLTYGFSASAELTSASPAAEESEESVMTSVAHKLALISPEENDKTDKSVQAKRNDPIHKLFKPPSIDVSERQINIIHQIECQPIPVLNQFSVCAILQSYMDSFPYVQYQNPGPQGNHDIDELNGEYYLSDINPQLAYETCTGLRTLFDAYLPTLLVTAAEKQSHNPTELIRNIDQTTYTPDTNEVSVYRAVYPMLPGYSLIYGYVHLLRLLYLLPRKILPDMAFASLSHEVILHRHLKFLIKFLDDNHDLYMQNVTTEYNH